MEKRKLSGDALENSQKRKARHYLKSVMIVAGGVAVAAVVLLYGRINSPSGPVSRGDSAPQGVVSGQREQDDRHGPAQAARRQFREKMNFYENEVKPRAAALNLSRWAPREQAALAAAEHDAVAAFANGDFARAAATADRLIATVSELQKDHEGNFRAAMEKAQTEFEAGRFEQALAALERAFLYKPDDSAAATLKGRVGVMEEVAALSGAAAAARIENRPDKEISLLARALRLDPARVDLAQRHRWLSERRRARDFDALVQTGRAALEKKDIKQARANLAKAARIFSDRKEIALLSGEIKRAEMKIIRRDLAAKARAAENDDDWPGAEAYYAEAVKTFPRAGQFEAGLKLARLINRRTQGLEQALSRPGRLSDSGVAEAARKLIKESRQTAGRSPKLRRLAAQLSAAVQRASLPVPVVVHSDNRTRVSVLGVGVIGKVKRYQLKEGLKPGTYTFKGERRGFKDKLVQIRISHGGSASVTVICDEPV